MTTTDKKKPKKKKSDTSDVSPRQSLPLDISLLDRFAEASLSDENWKTKGLKFVWIQHVQGELVVGELVSRDKEMDGFIVSTSTGEISVPGSEINLINSPTINLGDDITELEHLSNASLFYSLKMRYQNRQFYTWLGPNLVHVNPHKHTGMFTETKMKRYNNSRKDTAKPHIYALAETAYLECIRGQAEPFVMFLGESGSGKTENFDQFIKYLSFKKEDAISPLVMSALHLIDSFSNISTPQNSNASQNCKILEICFSQEHIVGAKLDVILFETHSLGSKRTFHIFHQLLTSQEMRNDFALKSDMIPNDPTDLDDSAMFLKTLESFKVLGIDSKPFLKQVAQILWSKQGEKDEKWIQYTFGSVSNVSFSQLFQNLVDQINICLHPKVKVQNSITCCELPGDTRNPMIREWNHIMLNLICEKMIKNEQELYVLEQIDWKYMNFDVHSEKMEYQHLNDVLLKFKVKIQNLLTCGKLYQVVCLEPNSIQKNGVVESKLVLDQIIKMNLVPKIKIVRKGFIDHIHPDDFLKRYIMLEYNSILNEQDDVLSKCKLICSKILVDSKNFKIGKTLLLCKYGSLFVLEDHRAQRIMELIVNLQSIARATLVRTNKRPIVSVNQEDVSKGISQKEFFHVKMEKERLEKEVVKLNKIIHELQNSKNLDTKNVEDGSEVVNIVALVHDLKIKVQHFERERFEKDEKIKVLEEAIKEANETRFMEKTGNDEEIAKLQNKIVEMNNLMKQKQEQVSKLEVLMKNSQTNTIEENKIDNETKVQEKSWSYLYYPIFCVGIAIAGHIFFEALKTRFPRS